ncbi:unnamed protein product [Nippostrongylus brasiliensis]|uniref:Peptidase_M1 domain-containing protein n=1 Tax=Nippostrongylus brasiliensis TaxID=27835 RepID=A0A0N4XPQ6_NIPBR|nr:unnamed protein product [Nippostrongylus brasiliensis]
MGFVRLLIRHIAPEYYDNLKWHESWVLMMYDFATNPAMSLRSRVKRKYAKPEEFHFYGVGKYETSNIYNAVVKVDFIKTILGSPRVGEIFLY